MTTKNCKPKAKKNVTKKSAIEGFRTQVAKYFPIGLIAFAGMVAVAAGTFTTPSTEAIEWPVTQEEVSKPVVAQVPVEVTLPPIVVEQEEAKPVTEPGIEWPVVDGPAVHVEHHEAVAPAPEANPPRVDEAQVVAVDKAVKGETKDIPVYCCKEVKYDAVTDTVTVKPKPEKKDIKKAKAKKKPTQKKKKAVKMTTANEDFMANFTRGMT